jgi:hypothetical protein
MSSMSRTVRRGASGALVSLAALVAIGSDHRTVSTCDRESDGNAVYAVLLLDNGNRREVWDSYDANCSTNSNFNSDVRTFRICEQSVGCSAWKDA